MDGNEGAGFVMVTTWTSKFCPFGQKRPSSDCLALSDPAAGKELGWGEFGDKHSGDAPPEGAVLALTGTADRWKGIAGEVRDPDHKERIIKHQGSLISAVLDATCSFGGLKNTSKK